MDDPLAREAYVDWQNCDLVESVAGKQGGVPLVKGTRIPAQQIVEEFELGSPVEEIAENYPSITRDQITALLVYADEHKSQLILWRGAYFVMKICRKNSAMRSRSLIRQPFIHGVLAA